jgi:hypothetical protein
MSHKQGNRSYHKAEAVVNAAIKCCDNVHGRGHRTIKFICDHGCQRKGDIIMVDGWTAYYLLNHDVAIIVK